MNNKILGSLSKDVDGLKLRARSVSKDFKMIRDYQQAWRMQEREKLEKKEVDQCTFKPDIKSSSKKFSVNVTAYIQDEEEAKGLSRFDQLYKVSKFQQAKREESQKIQEEIRKEKELEVCTFKPQLTKFEKQLKEVRLSTSEAPNVQEQPVNPKPVDKEKMKRVLEITKKSQQRDIERRLKMLRDVPEKKINKDIQQVLPLLYVDIDVGEGKKDRISVYPGDNPKVLAKKFCEKH